MQLDELSATEAEELGHAAPHLAQFLADGHPARDVTRNLFRLSRLALRPTGETPRSEVDMAAQWWSTADGERNGLQRDRARLLRDLALQLLSGAERLDVSSAPPAVIEALIGSGTLIDLGQDRVAFSHDVLREWAVASLLYDDGELLSRIDFSKRASATFSRAVELLARMRIERGETAEAWRTLLERVSAQGARGAWRRAAPARRVGISNGCRDFSTPKGPLWSGAVQPLPKYGCEPLSIVGHIQRPPCQRQFLCSGPPRSLPLGGRIQPL